MTKPGYAAKLIGGLAIGAVVGTAAIMGLVWLLSQSSMGASMSGHGWIALLAGTFISLLVAGALSAALVLGRRNGFDEGAHEFAWDPDDSDEQF
jgi:glutamate-1-semialdehyde aminotransferase